jgi:sugar phosphate isomerase/epimerase
MTPPWQAQSGALQLSFSTGALYHLPLRTVFLLACEAGLDGVELVDGPEVVLRGAPYVLRLSREYGVPIRSVHPPILPYPGMQDARRTLRRLVLLAQGVQCDLVVLHTPKTTSTEHPEWKAFLQALHEYSNHGVKVSLENAGYFRPSDGCYLLQDVHALSAFARLHDLPVTFDTSHAGTAPFPLLGSLALFKGRIVNVHLSDLVQRRISPNWRPLHTFLLHHQMPGKGMLPLADVVQVLVQSGYSGPLTLEISPTALGAWSIARVRTALADAVRFVREREAADAGKV